MDAISTWAFTVKHPNYCLLTFFILLFVQSSTNSRWHWVVSEMFLRKFISPSQNKCLIKFNKFTTYPQSCLWHNVKTRRTLGFASFVANLTLPKPTMQVRIPLEPYSWKIFLIDPEYFFQNMMRGSKSEGLHKWTFLFYIFIRVRKYHRQEFVIWSFVHLNQNKFKGENNIQVCGCRRSKYFWITDC